MPTYEYACTKCGHEFEFFQSMKDKPLTVCAKEKCKMKKWGKGRVKKLMSQGAGLIFKGSGFYITDYRSENYKESAKKETSAASGGESKTTGADAKTSGAETKSSGSETKSAPAKSDAKPAPKDSSSKAK
ncbi:MAG TPA: FmdB family zinc ribbon protein [Methylomirabilota bacterium]|nr:FmdB family zinc ribbon protein [Methylomirabilota bacterium]